MNARAHKPLNSSSTSSFTPVLTNIAQRKCACGGIAGLSGECSSCQKEKLLGGQTSVQAKLKVSQPNDKFEQEADRVADEVMRMPESKVQGQSGVKNKDSEGLIQTKSIASKITPLVQRESADEEEEQIKLKAVSNSATIQREESKDKPKSNEDKAKEALKKTGEAFLETEPGKKIKEKGKDVATTLPGVVIVGPAAISAVATIVALNKELPIQIPAIPLDVVHPGLSMNILIEGPVRTPSKVVIGFSGKFGAPKKIGRKKPAKTEAEKLREQNSAQKRKDFEFRESLKTPEEKARDQDFLNAFILQNMRDPTNPLFIPGLKNRNEVPFGSIQQEKPTNEKKEEGDVQRKERNESEAQHSDSSLVQETVQSSGHKLDPITRSFMEQRFGHDFSQVKIHIDNKATASSRAINARAYTLGQDIVFGAGQYSPETQSGKQLLAHELTHVVQQSPFARAFKIHKNNKSRSSSNYSVGSVKSGISQGSIVQPKPAESKKLSNIEKRDSVLDKEGGSPFDEGIRFFSKRKVGCVEPGSFRTSLGVHQNDENMATGLMYSSYKGVGKTRSKNGVRGKFVFGRGKRVLNSKGKVCDCDCITYRQFIRGISFQKLPEQAKFQKITNITSGSKEIALSSTKWTKEDTSTTCIHKPFFGCNRGKCEDHPGVDKGARTGIDALLRLNLLLQLWDVCQQKAIEELKRTLTITGDKPPRSIKWDTGLLPLTQKSLAESKKTKKILIPERKDI